MTQENPPKDEVLEKYEDNKEVSNTATKEALVNEIFENSVAKGGISDQDKARINELKASIESDRLINKALAKKDDGSESFTDTRNPDEKQEPSKKVTGLKKIALSLGFVFAGLAGQAKDGDRAPKDSTKEKPTYSLKNARKVNEIPPGYDTLHKGNKTYGIKSVKGSLEMAKGGHISPDDKGYEDWVITQLKSGTASPEELVQKKYISPDQVEKYRPYYMTDVVYIEKDQKSEENPFAAFAKKGEILYGPNKHAVAEMFYAVRDTKSIKDGGMLNTSKEDVLFRFMDDMGKFTGEYALGSSEDLPKLLAGTAYFQSQDGLEKLKAEASAKMNQKNDNKDDKETVDLQGSSMAQNK